MGWMGLDAEEYDRQYNDKQLVKRIGDYLKPYKKQIFLVVFFLTLSSVSNSLIPLLSSQVLALYFNSGQTAQFILVILATFTLNFTGYFFNYINQRYSNTIIGSMIRDLRTDVNDAVLNQDLSFFDEYPTGKIVSRINSDSQNFGETASLFMQTISSLMVVFFVYIPLFSINVKLTLIFSSLVPLLFLFTALFRKKARTKTLEGQRTLANVYSFVQETMGGIQIAKTFRQEAKLYEDFKNVNQECYKVNLSRAIYLNILFPGLGVIQGIVLILIMNNGGQLILGTELTGTDLYLFVQSLWILFFPLFTVATFWPQFQTGLAAAERIFALIDNESKVVQHDSQEIDIQGKIEIENLHFQYKDDHPIFQDFSLTIKPGESIAIVGHTGAGKSSLGKLLLRFYEYQEGNIQIDSHDIRDLELNHFRSQIGMIPQTPFLWADTLMNNIKYSKPDATEEEVWQTLEQAGGREWVDNLEDGINTDVRERGKRLSMGQRQLAAFARVLLQNPRILILDEASASIDPFTETRIQDALEKLMKGRTSIIIAHRLWTVRHVDRIIVLDHGKIIEEGSHEELMKKPDGYYSKLYTTYFRHQSYEFIEKRKGMK